MGTKLNMLDIIDNRIIVQSLVYVVVCYCRIGKQPAYPSEHALKFGPYIGEEFISLINKDAIQQTVAEGSFVLSGSEQFGYKYPFTPRDGIHEQYERFAGRIEVAVIAH
jgi:hypothetical protein